MITLIQFVIVFAAILIGVRYGGVALGFWGALGLIVLSVAFGVVPTAPPIDVMLIIFAVCLCASCMEAVGGLDILVRFAAKIIRKNPKYVAVVAPVVSFFLTFCSGTGNVVYAILPVIYEVSYNANVRPERAMAAAAVSGQVGITACPISAATAAMVGLLEQNGFGDIGLGDVLMITFPACLIGVLVSSFIGMFVGKELKPKEASWSVAIFFGAIIVIVVVGFFPELRILRGQENPVSMSLVIEAVMLGAGALMSLLCKPNVNRIVQSPVMTACVVSLGAVFGIAWMSDSFIHANSATFMEVAGGLAQQMPVLFAFVLAIMSALLSSQGATTRAIMPLGFALGISPMMLVAMFPAVNCLFILPTSGPALAAVGMDRSGTTHIGKFVFNHSFQLPGILMVAVAVAVGVVMVGIGF